MRWSRNPVSLWSRNVFKLENVYSDNSCSDNRRSENTCGVNFFIPCKLRFKATYIEFEGYLICYETLMHDVLTQTHFSSMFSFLFLCRFCYQSLFLRTLYFRFKYSQQSIPGHARYKKVRPI